MSITSITNQFCLNLSQVVVRAIGAIFGREKPAPRRPREWLVIEKSWKNSPFASDEDREPFGYIPRDVAEPLLGRVLGGPKCVWFKPEEYAVMRAHPEWRDSEPP